jgi:hypothetical protein
MTTYLYKRKEPKADQLPDTYPPHSPLGFMHWDLGKPCFECYRCSTEKFTDDGDPVSEDTYVYLEQEDWDRCPEKVLPEHASQLATDLGICPDHMVMLYELRIDDLINEDNRITIAVTDSTCPVRTITYWSQPDFYFKPINK